MIDSDWIAKYEPSVQRLQRCGFDISDWLERVRVFVVESAWAETWPSIAGGPKIIWLPDPEIFRALFPNDLFRPTISFSTQNF